MGQAVAERTVLRKKADGSFENWGDVAHRVALGNSLLATSAKEQKAEYEILRNHVSSAALLLSGRHLQHGDETQPTKNKELFTNCSTAAASFILFYLLMNGSGVGRCYDDDMIVVNWDNAPSLRVVLDHNHPNFDWSAHESVRDALHKYGPESRSVKWFTIPDSREGWAQALEVWETLAFEKIHADKMLILDFSQVRPQGAPIGGMQNRPASGPVPLMNAFMKAASLKGSGLDPWKQAIYTDHYFSECVLVGGARRAARMSTKFWKDPTILDFVRIKRPIEFAGKHLEEVLEIKKTLPPGSNFLWSSNNSITVDKEFWELLDLKRSDDRYSTDLAKHARKVWKAVLECSYGDGTGEPGIINVDKLDRNDEGLAEIGAEFVGSKKYKILEDTELLLKRLAKRAAKKSYNVITNPCGEIVLNVLGGYCVIADVVPYHCETLEEAEEAFRAATRALIRVNTMDCLYKAESKRTNRIGVGLTGVHEFAWKFFGVGFRDLIDPDFDLYNEWASKPFEGPFELNEDAKGLVWYWGDRLGAAAFWLFMKKMSDAVKEESITYSKHLGVKAPHTVTTIKPAGTTSKLFGLTEGWHLPAMAYYMRWVQFRSDDPLVEKYQASGYPTRALKTYEGTTIVGFPTAPTISTLGMGDKLVLAGEASPEEQYQWLMLGEKYWIGEAKGNQISYTLKYDPAKVDFKHYSEMMKKYQRQIKCCSVMPQEDESGYEYLPEERISKEEYESALLRIENVLQEEISREHVDCAGGACPIDFKDRANADQGDVA